MRTAIITIVAVALIAGCADMSKPYPVKALFTIDAGDPTRAVAKARSDRALRISGLRISQPYGGRGFVYKVGPAQFEMDYYNRFIASPDDLLTGELIEWLSRTKQFASVFGGGSSADYRWVLEGIITELYGDYTAKGEPHAVIAAQFFLLDDSAPAAKVIMQKTYHQRIATAGDTPTALAAGWGKAYGQILSALAKDLNRVEYPGP